MDLANKSHKPPLDFLTGVKENQTAAFLFVSSAILCQAKAYEFSI